jgi:WD40 repeat protein
MNSTGATMRCSLCGNQVPRDASFCPYCSQRLYRMAGLDTTELVTERTQGFTGREWVFQAIDEWLADPQGARAFLLTGGPGTGKTAIAAQLVRMAEGEVPADPYPHLGAGSIQFFQFCQAFHNDTLDPLRFTKHLSLHLAGAYPPFAEALTEAGARDPGIHVVQEVGTAERALVVGTIIQELHIGNLSARVAFDRVVAGPLKQIPQADPPGAILILLDALDEALTYPGETLVDLLAHILDDPRDLPDRVRFLLTSRPDERVTHLLGQPVLDLIDDAPADVDDVRAYTHRRLPALAEPRRSDLADRIANASKGNFLYARYVIDDLPPDLDQVEDPAGLPLPEDLHDVYRQFLERELGRSLDTWDDDYAPLLGVLAVARGDGLTSAQLAGVTKQRGNRMRRLLRTCGQYLAGPQPEGPFRIYHQSFREFLLEDSRFKIYPSEANQDVADYCWRGHATNWHDSDIYCLLHLPAHISQVGQVGRLRELLPDLDWLEAKLGASDVAALIRDYDLLPGDDELRLVQDALRLSAPVLSSDKGQLRSQLCGRLQVHEEVGAVRSLLAQVREQSAGPWLRPLTPSMALPGGPLLNTLTGHSDSVNAVAVTPDGHYIVSGSADGTLRVWNLEDGTQVRTIRELDGEVLDIALVPGGRQVVTTTGVRYASGAPNALTLWDLDTGTALRRVDVGLGTVSAIAVTPDGGQVLFPAYDADLDLWALNTWDLEGTHTPRLTQGGHEGGMYAVAVAADGQYAVTGGSDNAIKVWDLETGAELRTLRGHTGWIYGVAVTPDGRRVVSVSTDMTVMVWDLQRGTRSHILRGHTDHVNAVAVTLDGRYAVSGSSDSTVRMWDLESGAQVRVLEDHLGRVHAVSVTPDGRRAISGAGFHGETPDNTLKVWDLRRPVRQRIPRGHDAHVYAIAVTPDGSRVLTASRDCTLKVWDLDSGAELHTLKGHQHHVMSVDVTPDSQHAVSASRDRTIKVWDLESGDEVRTLSGHADAVNGVAVMPDGRRCISASTDQTLKMWDLDSGEPLYTLEGHRFLVTRVAVTGDGRRAVSGSWDFTLRVWDLEAGKELHTLAGHAHRVPSVTVTPDGQWALSASEDGTLKVWDLARGRELRTLQGHTREVWYVAVTPDGRYAVSASSDFTLKVWDLRDGAVITEFRGEYPLLACAVAPDGRTIVAGDQRGRVHFLRLEGVQ